MHDRPLLSPILPASSNRTFAFNMAPGSRTGNRWRRFLSSALPAGEAIRIIASGPDAEAALKALKEAVDSGLGDVEETREAIEADKWVPVSGGHAPTGVSASPGIAIGPVYQFQTTHIVVEDKPEDPESEKLALKRASRPRTSK